MSIFIAFDTVKAYFMSAVGTHEVECIPLTSMTVPALLHGGYVLFRLII